MTYEPHNLEIICDNCKTSYNTTSQLGYDNETGEYYCKNCGSNQIMEVENIDVDIINGN